MTAPHASSSVKQAAHELRSVLGAGATWAAGPGIGCGDELRLRKWERGAAHIARSADRPPAIGLFGESQVGKSFLVSSLVGGRGSDEIRILDPEHSGTGRISHDKPWAKEVAAKGGLDFISWVNVQNQSESTGILCRFTRHPTDVPRQPDCFAGRLLGHAQVLLSLATGYLYEVGTKDSIPQLRERIDKTLKDVDGAPVQPAGRELNDLREAWTHLQGQHASMPYVQLLEEAGFGARLVANRQPSGPAWARLAGMLWGCGAAPLLDELYARLHGLLVELRFADVLEIPSRVVCRLEEPAQQPLTDVQLLDRLFDDNERRVEVWCRGDEEATARRILLTRPQISALLAELTLPVKPSAEGQSSVLDHADLLDFPGARAPQEMNKPGGVERDRAEYGATFAFRRGKLTQLFNILTDQREISTLCLAVPADNFSALTVMRQLLGHWLGRGDSEQADRAAVAEPDMLLIVTKADKLLEKGVRKHPFGSVLQRVRREYTLGSNDRDNWLDNWSGSQPFRNVYWVLRPDKATYPKQDVLHLDTVRREYLGDPDVLKHVVEPGHKFDELLRDGGVTLLADELVEHAQRTDKLARLAGEVRELARTAHSHLAPFHMNEDEHRRQAAAQEAARRDLAALDRVTQYGDGHVMSAILGALTLRPGPVRNLIDASHQPEAARLRNFPEFWTAFSSLVASSIKSAFQSPALRELLRDGEGLADSLSSQMSRAVEQRWMHEAMREAVEGLFEGPASTVTNRWRIEMISTWVVNRGLVHLGHDPEPRGEPTSPPTLRPESDATWRWILDHWKAWLPDVYVANVSQAGPPPAGNKDLGDILDRLAALAGAP
jgi:hypothetical protein